jgi:mannose-6-phosphate isomerase-like protein (cupin superfamily)
MKRTEHKDFASPDETRRFPHGHVDLLNVGGGVVGRLTLEPGWKWSNDVKSIAKTDWCEAPHFQYHVSGTLHVQMEDGEEFDVGPGSISALPKGHDAWVVGKEKVVLIDFFGATHYAKK